MNARVGHGFDIHPLEAGRPLVLGGVEIPSEFGCAGHSDADVVLHAVSDALLGACGLGDLGEWFPDTDPAYKDADSAMLLGRVVEAVARAGASPVNVDITLYLERPRLAPFKPAMRDRVAQILGVPASCVGVKARTLEGFGPIGKGEAAAATAVVLVELAPRGS